MSIAFNLPTKWVSNILALLTDVKIGEPLTMLEATALFATLVEQARTVAWQELSINEGQHIFEIAARPMQVKFTHRRLGAGLARCHL